MAANRTRTLALRSLRTAVLVGVLLLVVIAGGVAVTGRVGSNRVEQWVGQRLVEVVATYLTLGLEFGDLDYQYPRTVVLRDVRLIADPSQSAAAGRGEVVVAQVGELTLELAEVPRRGEPLRVARLLLDEPTVRVVMSAGGGVVGFSPLMREEALPLPDGGPDLKLSEAFVATRIEIKGGRVAYQGPSPDAGPLRIDGVNMTIEFDAQNADAYQLIARVDRGDGLDFNLDATLRPDAKIVDINRFTLAAAVNDRVSRSLPGVARQLIKRYGVTGSLRIEATGTADLTDPTRSVVDVRTALDGAGLTLGDQRWSADSVAVLLSMTPGRIVLKNMLVEALGGLIEASGHVLLTDELNADLRFVAEDLDLELLDPQYAGILNAEGTVSNRLADPLGNLGGAATFSVRDGRLTDFPLLRQLSAAIDSVGESDSGRDTADGVLEMMGDHVYLRTLNFKGDAVAARGRGNVYLDGALDLLMRAGPLEKAERLFVVGDILAKASDLVLPLYRVGGGLKEMAISLVPPNAELVTPFEERDAAQRSVGVETE
jgi:hypothetical protein